MKNCDLGLENAFSRPRSQIFPIRTDPKPANNVFIFFPVVYWLASGFVYATSSMNWLTCRLQTIAKNVASDGE